MEAMEIAIQDPQRKTDIRQLLNPPHEGASAFPAPDLQHHYPAVASRHHHTQQVYFGHVPAPYSNPRPDWGSPSSIDSRKANESIAPSQQYSQPVMNGDDRFGIHVPRTIRSARMNEEGAYTQNPWSTGSQNGGSEQYVMYSAERTPLTSDFPAQNTVAYQQPEYRELEPPADVTSASRRQPSYSESESYEAYQPCARPSLRQATKRSMPEQQHHSDFYYQQGYDMSHQTSYQVDAQYEPSTSNGKRTSPHSDDSLRPKKQRKQRTSEPGPHPSKRGYNAKKRSEAAQMTAQNMQLASSLSYQSNGKGKERAIDATGHMYLVEDPTNQASGQLIPELQLARCMSTRYRSEEFSRCVSCTRRWAGDTCRFQGVRYFLKDEKGNVMGVSFVTIPPGTMPIIKYPTTWNIPLSDEYIKITKRTTARALLPILKQESDHIIRKETVYRTRESEVRATCDTCMTSLFCNTWMCRICGREACADCFAQIEDLTMNLPEATHVEIVEQQQRREQHSNRNPFFLACNKRHEHQAKDFLRVTRFCKEELEDAIAAMELVNMEADRESNGCDAPKMTPSASGSSADISGVRTLPEAKSLPQQIVKYSTNYSHHQDQDLSHALIPKPIIMPAAPGPQLYPNDHNPTNIPDMVPFHPIQRLKYEEVTDDVFHMHLTNGQPLLINGMLEKLKISWSPEYFIQHHGDEGCLIVECQTDVLKRVTVGRYFREFGRYEDRKECWKLKDWPPSSDFQSVFPELYEDFCQAVPMPNYIRRDGVKNISSHFPLNTVSPDLGPKMYNAMASNQQEGSKGSTRLHMDMADALNIMTYSCAGPDGSPGCAAWDLFRREDNDTIRQFLKQKFGFNGQDPIHSQQFYLTEDLRLELWQQYHVQSYRVYQRPGEAIVIPAGCAHQVCNLADCVKVAIDYVSPENINRCEQLTREFREQNHNKQWKEDVLQLGSMLWFAWQSCSRQERAHREATPSA
ncbi:hypothetical protein EDD85DRAFT_810740 [Armillaria nabsnona]|nr:hypothetical protein EDD85DRAFT_810740 [Armillaria nabsnona]